MMQGPSAQQQNLPIWAQVLSLGIALFLAFLQGVQFFRLPELYVRLTRDLFFRLMEDGEALFCHAVLLARKGPVLIQDIGLTLRRVGNRDRAEKTFPIRVVRFGEKVKGPGFVAEHHFYSSSPLLYLPESSPLRAVYLGVQREYQAPQKRAVQAFVRKVRELKEKYSQSPTEPLDQEQGTQVLNELNSLITDSYREMIGLVQLEIGDYDLHVRVTYQMPGFTLWKRHGTSESKISFSVDEESLANWKAGLRDTLRIQANNLLTDQTAPVTYPAFQPLEFTEFEGTV